jgi:hypothetical protein
MTVNESSASRKFLLTVAALLLWIVTVVLGAYSVMVTLDTVIFVLQTMPLLGLMTGRVTLAGLMSSATWIVMALGGIIWLIITIGGLEYHFKRVGRPESWRLFAWTIGFELILIVLGFIIPELLVWLV